MSNPLGLTDRRNPAPSFLTGAREAWQKARRSPKAPLRRRFHRTIGFCLGGVLLGLGGCILGSCMPYRHPVAVTISVLWWGIYFGCFGASIGALLGLWAEQIPGSPSRRPDGAGKLPKWADSSALPGAYSGTLIRAASRDQETSR